MSASAPRAKPQGHFKPSDLRGIAQLATQATRGVAGISEGVHQSVWGTMGVPGGKTAGRTRGLTGLVYRCVHSVNDWVGKGLDAVLGKLEPLLATAEQCPAESPQRMAIIAALNGVLGDHLADTHNPLALPMTLRVDNILLDWTAMPEAGKVSGKVLIVIHGLCMNEQQWQPPQWDSHDPQQYSDHVAALASQRGYTPVFVRYNTGLHISQNGVLLAQALEQLVRHWPVAVEDLSILAHSMGGLVSRSAHAYALEHRMRWPQALKHLVFLGTPHHGAPLERAGNWVDVVLGSTPYSRPFAKLGQLRSAGITDLRYGHVLESDWAGHARFRRKPDSQTHQPLPAGVACFTVAATVAKPRSLLAERLVGDGLVPLRSALGQHDDPGRTLAFAPQAQHTIYRMNHMELLHSPLVTDRLLKWIQ
jgi:hypothetical protein